MSVTASAKTGPIIPRSLHMLVIGVLVVVAVLAIGFAAIVFSGGPVANETACSAGEAPANSKQGGSDCFKVGSNLPSGFTWDSRGNYRIN